MISFKSAEAAAELLGVVLDTTTEEEICDAYRAMAKTAHPDAGGDAATFVDLDRSKCLLLEWLKRKPADDVSYKEAKCLMCGGIGKVTLRRGFGSMTIVCGSCGGSGDARYKADPPDH